MRNVLVQGERIEKIATGITADDSFQVMDAKGKFLLPGMIDDQVHFREPGLTNKGDLATESAAAVAGGITSFMDMPNVNPQTTNRQALADKYVMAEGRLQRELCFLSRRYQSQHRRSKSAADQRILWHQSVYGCIDW